MKTPITVAMLALMTVALPAQSEGVYVSVAVNSIHTEEGFFEFKWAYGYHEESSYEANQLALAECQKMTGGEMCSVIGGSLRGGCVAVVMGSWRELGEPQVQRQLFAVANNRQDIAERWALDSCKASIYAGHDEGTIRNHVCRGMEVYCSEETLNPIEKQDREE